MKMYFIYQHEPSLSKEIKLNITYKPSTKLTRHSKKHGRILPHNEMWYPLDINGNQSILLNHYIDFFFLSSLSPIPEMIKAYLKYILSPLANRVQDCPITDSLNNMKKLSSWFDEIAVKIEGPYSLHYDYAQQYRQIQHHLAITRQSELSFIEDIYQFQRIFFPPSINSIAKQLPKLSTKWETQLSYLELMHYLSRHTNKASGVCYKPTTQIQADLSLTQATLNRWLQILLKQGWLEKANRQAHLPKIAESTALSIKLTPMFWCIYSGLSIDDYRESHKEIYGQWIDRGKKIEDMTATSYPYEEHVAQVQQILKLLKAATKSKIQLIRTAAIKELTLFRYG